MSVTWNTVVQPISTIQTIELLFKQIDTICRPDGTICTIYIDQPNCCPQNGIQEEELGPVSLVSEGDGPSVQAGLGEGGAADAG